MKSELGYVLLQFEGMKHRVTKKELVFSLHRACFPSAYNSSEMTLIRPVSFQN